jgi:uncharacterized protein (UPF0261 family)
LTINSIDVSLIFSYRPFHDPEATYFFGEALKKHLQPGISLHLLPYHINDLEFAEAVIESLEQVLKMKIKPAERR